MIPRIFLGFGFGFRFDCAGILCRVCWHEGCLRTLPRPFRCFLLLVRFLIVAPLSTALQGAGSQERYLCVCVCLRVCVCASIVGNTFLLGFSHQYSGLTCSMSNEALCPKPWEFLYFCSFVAQLPFLDLYYDLPKNSFVWASERIMNCTLILPSHLCPLAWERHCHKQHKQHFSWGVSLRRSSSEKHFLFSFIGIPFLLARPALVGWLALCQL